MFDFIPIELYTAFYYHLMCFIMVLFLVLSLTYNMGDIQSISLSNFLGYMTFILLVFYMGFRPVSGKYFGDMDSYDMDFRIAQQTGHLGASKDILFNYFIYYSAQIFPAGSFFFVVDLIYIVPCYLFSKKYCGNYWPYVFFMFLGSFSFWTYGTNGLRNGMATAMFVLALYFYERKIVLYALLALCVGIHKSLIISVAAFLVSGLYKKPKVYLYIWLASIPLSLVGGTFWGGFFAGMFEGDVRANAYLTAPNNAEGANFSSTGFRWDFVFYSSFAVFAGWYFIFKKKIEDRFYIHLWGMYMIANAFWILVIRANFSNRFAYLSWFLMAPVIAYPLFKYKLFNDQFKVAGLVLAAYYLFTYLMFLKS